MKKLFLLDGMALIYRAHFALSKAPRFTSGGLNTSAMLGFTNTLLEVLRKEDQRRIDRMIVVHHPMLVRIETGKDGCPRRRAERRRDERIPEVHAVTRQAIERRRVRIAALAQESHCVVAVIVGQDEHDVAWLDAGPARQRR